MFQRQVTACQLVPRKIRRHSGSTRVKTVGGRTLVVNQAADDGKLTVNDVAVLETLELGDIEVWILEKLLFIRPEDVELGVGRVRGDVK